ncbi:hypothetical protein N8525_03560 [Verrucomicrobiales bacterium]|nr:hypothetical protein [Verrucomicrobiales bacterium]
MCVVIEVAIGFTLKFDTLATSGTIVTVELILEFVPSASEAEGMGHLMKGDRVEVYFTDSRE